MPPGSPGETGLPRILSVQLPEYVSRHRPPVLVQQGPGEISLRLHHDHIRGAGYYEPRSYGQKNSAQHPGRREGGVVSLRFVLDTPETRVSASIDQASAVCGASEGNTAARKRGKTGLFGSGIARNIDEFRQNTKTIQSPAAAVRYRFKLFVILMKMKS